MLEVGYEDDDIRVIIRKGSSLFALITFGDMISLTDGVRYTGDKLCERDDITAIGFTAKRPNWYPRPAVLAAAKIVSSRLQGISTRVLYGGSMGGYAALKYSRALGASQVLALCPQWSIDRAECQGWNPGYQEYFVPSMTGMGIRREDVAERAFVLSDPIHEPDRTHTRSIIRISGAIHIPTRNVAHHVTTALAGSDNLVDLIQCCLSADPGRIARAVNSITRKSSARYLVLLDRANAASHFRLASSVMRNSKDDCDYARKLRFKVASALIADGQLGRAKIHFERILAESPNPSDQFRAKAVLDRAPFEFTIQSKKGTLLAYDVENDVVIGVNDQSSLGRRPFLPITIAIAGQNSMLSTVARHASWTLAPDDQNQLRLAKDVASPFFDFTVVAGKGAAFKYTSGYLSAEPSGRVVCDRKVAKDWEIFRLR